MILDIWLKIFDFTYLNLPIWFNIFDFTSLIFYNVFTNLSLDILYLYFLANFFLLWYCSQIYYLEDSTAEWISISEEFVFVAQSMVIARMRCDTIQNVSAQDMKIKFISWNICLMFLFIHSSLFQSIFSFTLMCVVFFLHFYISISFD